MGWTHAAAAVEIHKTERILGGSRIKETVPSLYTSHAWVLLLELEDFWTVYVQGSSFIKSPASRVPLGSHISDNGSYICQRQLLYVSFGKPRYTNFNSSLLNIYVLIIIAVGTIKLPGNISVGIIFYRYDNCMCH